MDNGRKNLVGDHRSGGARKEEKSQTCCLRLKYTNAAECGTFFQLVGKYSFVARQENATIAEAGCLPPTPGDGEFLSLILYINSLKNTKKGVTTRAATGAGGGPAPGAIR